MVSLYEAAHLRTTTDDILDEALTFTTSILESLAIAGEILPHVSMHIQNALCMPQHYDAEMVYTKEYISFYEKRRRSQRDATQIC